MGSRSRPPTPAACTMPPPPHKRARSATALLRMSGEAPWLLLVRSEHVVELRSGFRNH